MKVCEALLDGGADPAAQSGEECTVLHYLVQVVMLMLIDSTGLFGRELGPL